MKNEYTAVIKHEDDWWIGWIVNSSAKIRLPPQGADPRKKKPPYEAK